MPADDAESTDEGVDHHLDPGVDHHLDPDDLGSDAADPGPDAPPRARRAPGGAFGTAMGAAMMGLHQVLYGPTKDEIVVQIEASGDPPNLDTDGLDAPFGTGRLVGPPLDAIKSRATRRRSKRHRPS